MGINLFLLLAYFIISIKLSPVSFAQDLGQFPLFSCCDDKYATDVRLTEGTIRQVAAFRFTTFTPFTGSLTQFVRLIPRGTGEIHMCSNYKHEPGIFGFCRH